MDGSCNAINRGDFLHAYLFEEQNLYDASVLVAALFSYSEFNYGRFLVIIIHSGEFDIDFVLRSFGSNHHFRNRLHCLYDRNVRFRGNYHFRRYESNRFYRRNSGILFNPRWFSNDVFSFTNGV